MEMDDTTVAEATIKILDLQTKVNDIIHRARKDLKRGGVYISIDIFSEPIQMGERYPNEYIIIKGKIT